MSLDCRKSITAVAIGLMFGVPVNADVNNDLRICDGITGRIKRDKCFYALQGQLSNAVPNTSSNTMMKWRVNKESSRDVGSSNIIISLDATASIFGRPAKANTASLILWCKDRKPAVSVVTGMSPQNFTYGPDGGVVIIQFDKEKSKRHHVLQSNDEKAIFLEKSEGLINKMIQHNRMFLTFSPFNSSPAMATFDLRGLEDAMKPLKNTCNW
jgi:type VI secretion system protein VasI